MPSVSWVSKIFKKELIFAFLVLCFTLFRKKNLRKLQRVAKTIVNLIWDGSIRIASCGITFEYILEPHSVASIFLVF